MNGIVVWVAVLVLEKRVGSLVIWQMLKMVLECV